jgi:hypothetical protein
LPKHSALAKNAVVYWYSLNGKVIDCIPLHGVIILFPNIIHLCNSFVISPLLLGYAAKGKKNNQIQPNQRDID